MELKKLETQQDSGYADTMAALKNAEQSLPSYSGSYDSEIKSIYNKIVNREGFKYDFAADPIYRSYQDRYRREGRLAMRDSMAESANLTGGYASSYSQAVGQQQYEAYLEKLGQVMPELYSAAYERYKYEGDRLNAQFNAASSLGQSEYNRYADELERDFEQEKFKYQQKSDAYDALADAIITSGYSPSKAELNRTGMSAELAQALKHEYMRRNELLPEQQDDDEPASYNAYYYGYSEKAGGGSSGSVEATKLRKN